MVRFAREEGRSTFPRGLTCHTTFRILVLPLTEQVGSPARSKDYIDAATADANSPQTSPKRKHSASESESSGPQKKADRKPGLRARIWTSLKKTVNRSEGVAAPSCHRGDVRAISLSVSLLVGPHLLGVTRRRLLSCTRPREGIVRC